MRLKVPHGHQPNDYTCGPKTIWMVLRFFGRQVPLARLVELCHATSQEGTSRKNMKATMRALEFVVHSQNNANMRDLHRWINRGVPVIVNFRGWENIGHYAVVTGVSLLHVYLHDPGYGSNLKISKKEFVGRWYGKHESAYTRWFMAAMPRQPKHPRP